MKRTTLLGVLLAFTRAAAQPSPPVRQIGRLERVSSEMLGSIAIALPMANGSVMVNDRKTLRVLLFDSTLSRAIVVADSTSATGNAYGRGGAVLIRYRGDSVLFIDQASLSMYVLTPSGAIARTLAIPRPDDRPGLIGGPFGTPGIDSRGRLVYFVGQTTNGVLMLSHDSRLQGGREQFPNGRPVDVDSGFLVRVDLATRAVDTVASLRTPKQRRLLKLDDNGFITSIETKALPFAVVDDWTMVPDGTIAIVRGQDFHVDWFADGRLSSSPKVAFDWQRLDDARKQTLIDSAAAAFEAQVNRRAGPNGAASGAAGAGRGTSGGRGGSGTPGNFGGPVDLVPNVITRAALGDVPDYWMAFDRGATHADVQGNLWIRTTSTADGRPVYDVINRDGALIDRVQLPAFRVIAGFGPGVIYMALQDSAGAVHLERARVR